MVNYWNENWFIFLIIILWVFKLSLAYMPNFLCNLLIGNYKAHRLLPFLPVTLLPGLSLLLEYTKENPFTAMKDGSGTNPCLKFFSTHKASWEIKQLLFYNNNRDRMLFEIRMRNFLLQADTYPTSDRARRSLTWWIVISTYQNIEGILQNLLKHKHLSFTLLIQFELRTLSIDKCWLCP